MLYVTTRSKNDAFTAARALNEQRGRDGGAYLPFNWDSFPREQTRKLPEQSFGQNVADVLNFFFAARVDAMDVDFALGRYPYKIASMSHRVHIIEPWHNPDKSFSRVVRNLTGYIPYSGENAAELSNWSWIAVRIAFMFGLFGDLIRNGTAGVEKPVDIAVDVNDFSGVMAAWYARGLGLPIGTIICGCNENGSPWELLHRGEMRTNSPLITTLTPGCDYAVHPDIERLIYGVYGLAETQRYVDICKRGGVYTPPAGTLDTLREGLFAAVVSQKRMEATIRNVFATKTYLLSPYSALAYAGLQDYRAVAGETRPALIMTEQSPSNFPETVAKAMGLSVDAWNERFNIS